VTGPKPTPGYLLCSSPRSGSTLLCDLLARSRVAGAPESYFRPASVPDYSHRWGLKLGSQGWDRSYLDDVRVRGESGTGCFAMRIMWSDMPALLDRLGVLYPDVNGDQARLRSALGIEHFVHLSRADKVAQAVSLVIAAQTGLWHRNADGTIREGGEPVKPARYDHSLIAHELNMLEMEQRGWARWFSEHSIAPLILTYEALSTDPAETARVVLDHVGVRFVDVPTVGTAKLATSLHVAWAERFNAEHGRSRT
jgi:LPS sulfotransferase NodH